MNLRLAATLDQWLLWSRFVLTLSPLCAAVLDYQRLKADLLALAGPAADADAVKALADDLEDILFYVE